MKKAGGLNNNKFAGTEGTFSVNNCSTGTFIITVRKWGVPGLQRGGTPVLAVFAIRQPGKPSFLVKLPLLLFTLLTLDSNYYQYSYPFYY